MAAGHPRSQQSAYILQSAIVLSVAPKKARIEGKKARTAAEKQLPRTMGTVMLTENARFARS